MDGIEWREGMTRCPEHDVDLVDEPPEPEPRRARFEGVRLEGLAGPAAVVAALAGIVYAVAGTTFNVWAWLATSRQWTEDSGGIEAVRFVYSAAWDVGIGAFACLGAAVLAKTYIRVTRPPDAPGEEVDDDEEEEGDVLPIAGGGFMTAVSTLTACFALAWIAIAVVVAWKTGAVRDDPYMASQDEGFRRLLAYQSAAAACTIGSLVVMGSLLMGRVHDRLAGIR